MDRLISEKAVLEAFREYQGSISDFYKAVKAIPSAEYETEITKYSDDEKYKALITLYFASINCEDKEKRKRYNTAIKLIEGIPSAEPKTGHWILKIEDWNKWTCSECGYTERTDIHVSLGYDFCPKCGAKMVESQERGE